MSRWAISDLNPAMRQQVEAKLRRGATIREHDSDGKCRIEIPVPAKPSKYGNERCVVDGLHFRSLKEVRRYRELRILEAAGQIKDLRREVPFELRVNGRTICVYVADFVYYVTGRMVMHPTIEDVKGMRKGIAYRLFKIKVALMHAIHGHVVVEI